jgi:hypothetical protein
MKRGGSIVKRYLPDILAILLAIMAFIVTAHVSEDVFERVPHIEDEFAILWQAEVMADGEIKIPSPREPKAFLVPFVVDYEGQRFGKYLPGWPAALSLGARFDLYWLINPLFAALSIWLVYRIGSTIVNPWVGLVSAGLTLSSPMFLMLSGTLMSHNFSLFLTAAFSLAWLKLFPSRSRQEYGRRAHEWLLVVLAGLSMGLLVITRPLTALGISIPFILHALYMLMLGGRVVRYKLVGVCAVVLLMAGLLPIWQAALTGDPSINPYTLWWSYDRVGFGPGIGVTENGHSLAIALNNASFSLRAGQHDLFGWPYISWLFLPFGLIAFRRNRDGLLFFGIFPGLVLVYAAYWIGSWLFGPRYYYEALPALAVTSAAGVAWAGSFLTEVPSARWRRPLTVGILAVLVLGNIVFYLPGRVGGMRGLYNISGDRIDFIEQQELGEALVIVHSEHWMEYANLLLLSPPFSDSDLLISWSRGDVKDKKLIEDLSEYQVFHYYADDPRRLYSTPRSPTAE